MPHSHLLASEAAINTVELNSFSSSDGFQQKEINALYRNHRRELFNPYNNEAETSWDWGVSALMGDGHNSAYKYTGAKLQIIGGRKISKSVNLETKLGIHQLKNTTTNDTKNIFAGNLKGQFILNDIYSGSLDIVHGLARGGAIQQGAMHNQYQEISLNSSLSAKWSKHWQSILRSQNTYLSDSNQKSIYDFSTLYGISTGTPWIWAGVGIEKLNYTKRSEIYWSPVEFLSFGPRLDATVPISGKFSASTGLNLNRLYDKDTRSWGSGYYFSGRLQYGDRNEFNIALNWIRIESIQNGNKWKSNQVGLNLSRPY